jgi:flagellar motor switch protein FliN/FliY
MSDQNTLKADDLPDFKKSDGPGEPVLEGAPPAQPSDSSVYRIPVQVMAVLGKAVLQVNDLMKLGRGAVIELDSKVGEPIEIYVNNRRVAKGELIIQGERLSVSMTEVLKIQDG